ncbi:MAG: hypothetical protein ABI443_03490 [Chthoniobacterales bacterium]
MARRSRSKPNYLIIGAAAVLILAAIFGAKIFMGEGNDPYRKFEKLDTQTYLENSNSLRGNVYKIEGEVMNDLAWSPSQGRLFSFGINNSSSESSYSSDKHTSVIPILIPVSLNSTNIQKGQRFMVLIEVMDNGILRAKEITKASKS